MNKKVNMNVFLHFLLVTKKMNNFTVTEARDVLLHEQSAFTDAAETRKFIYRQLTRHIEKRFLKRTNKFNNGAKKVIYSKSNLFFNVQFVPVSRKSKTVSINEKSKKASTESNKNISYEEELKKELLAYEIDLNTVLEEAKEYKRLIARFPKLQMQLQQHHSQAEENSIKLLGKIRALQNLLGNEIVDQKSC